MNVHNQSSARSCHCCSLHCCLLPRLRNTTALIHSAVWCAALLLIAVALQGAGSVAGMSPPAVHLTPPVALQSPSAPAHSAQPSNEQSQNQLQRLLQALASAAATANSAPSTAAATGAGTAASSNTTTPSVDTAALTRSLAGVVAQLSRSGQSTAARETQLPPHSLLDVLQPDTILPLLQHDDIKQLAQLLPTDSDKAATDTAQPNSAHTDSGGGSVDSAAPAPPTSASTSLPSLLSRHMRSAQFQQTAGRMQSLLYSENYGSLLSSLGLDTAAGGFGVDGLVAAIERQVRVDRDRQTAAQQSSQQQQPQQPQ